jgi:hypothetical protein
MYLTRVLKATVQEVHAIARASTDTHARLRDRLAGLVLVTIVVDLVCAVLALFLERHVHNTQIHTFGSALFWTSTQLLTVSSQIQNPFSFGARVLDVAMEAYAITVVATLAAALGAFLTKRAHELEQESARA